MSPANSRAKVLFPLWDRCKITELLHLHCRWMVVLECGAVVEQPHIFFQCFLARNVYLCFILLSPMPCEVSDLLYASATFTGNPERSDLLSLLQLAFDWHFCMSGVKPKLSWFQLENKRCHLEKSKCSITKIDGFVLCSNSYSRSPSFLNALLSH